VTKGSSFYKSANGEFRVIIRNTPKGNGTTTASIELARAVPDPTPTDIFDPYREVENSFGIFYRYDLTRGNAGIDLPLLRAALLSLVNSGFETRLIGGEK